MNSKFCGKFMKKFAVFLKDKYSTFFKYVLLLDEFVSIVYGEKLLKYSADRAILHKYKILAGKCRGGKECYDICKEFNLNKFTYLFDGESVILKDFQKSYRKILDVLTDPKMLPKMLEKKKLLPKKNLFAKAVKYSALRDKYKPMKPLKPWDKDYKKYNRSSIIDLGDKSKMPRKYIEKIHPVHSVTIETLDD